MAVCGTVVEIVVMYGEFPATSFFVLVIVLVIYAHWNTVFGDVVVVSCQCVI